MNAQTNIFGNRFSFDLGSLLTTGKVLAALSEATDELKLDSMKVIERDVIDPILRSLMLIEQVRVNIEALEVIANSDPLKRVVFEILKAKAFELYSAEYDKQNVAGDEQPSCGPDCACAGETTDNAEAPAADPLSAKANELAAAFAAQGIPQDEAQQMAASILQRFPDADSFKVINVGIL